jgi:hypothetical protein
MSDVLDYLGRRQPIGQQTIGGLPSSDGELGGVGFGGGVGAPVTGLGGPSGDTTGGSGGLGVIARTPILRPESQSALSLAARAVGAGQQGWNWLNAIFGDSSVAGSAPSWSTLGAEAWAGGADQLASSGATTGVGGEAALGGFGVLSEAAPIWGGLVAAVDLLGPHTLPFQGIIESLFGLNEPSQAWLNFGGSLRNTLMSTETANEQLGRALLGANTQDEQLAALNTWRQAIRAAIPGWGPNDDAQSWEIPGLPGATGRNHEWRTVMDFTPEVLGLRAELDAARQGLPSDARQRAFLEAAQGWQAEQTALRQRRDQDYQDWLSTYDPGSGSA